MIEEAQLIINSGVIAGIGSIAVQIFKAIPYVNKAPKKCKLTIALLTGAIAPALWLYQTNGLLELNPYLALLLPTLLWMWVWYTTYTKKLA